MKEIIVNSELLNNIDIVFAQSELDKDRLSSLGAKNIIVNGNIKLTNLPKVTKNYQKPNSLIITAASTHESEEELILNAWNKKGKLIITPRHPERFDKVYELIKNYANKNNLSFHRFSQEQHFNSDIILIDLMGELINIYAISDIVILGGSFIKSAGGHNPIEPAFFNVKLISGKTIFNQKSLFDAINDYYLIKSDELSNYFNNINNLKNSSIKKIGDIKAILKEINGKSI
jgi:3-deoxy-D-manno-octulosonic-acid transferase